jgi:arginine N-succinyltransferase
VLILRPIAAGDVDALAGLARLLDSVNLPSDPEWLAERIELSTRSFEDRLEHWHHGIYVFVLEDSATGRCVGTSSILAKHGKPGLPYFWLEVTSEERRSAELGKRLVHRKLQMRSTEDGPTEIGGIILEPAYRRHPEKCGKALSIARFAYISWRPERFEREVIAEMMSPFEAPGRNLLWDAFGARFTGLSYREADRLSSRSKQFIADLFPRDPVYVTLFPPEVQEMIGQTHETAKAALRISWRRSASAPWSRWTPSTAGPTWAPPVTRSAPCTSGGTWCCRASPSRRSRRPRASWRSSRPGGGSGSGPPWSPWTRRGRRWSRRPAGRPWA